MKQRTRGDGKAEESGQTDDGRSGRPTDSKVYWEGTDPDTGEGDGVYVEAETADNDEAWVC